MFEAEQFFNKLQAKCIIQIFMSNLYLFCYVLIYKCILEYINNKYIIIIIINGVFLAEKKEYWKDGHLFKCTSSPACPCC